MGTDVKPQPPLAEPRRVEPLTVDFHDATAEQLARAFFATVPPPDPSQQHHPRRSSGQAT